MEKAIMSEEEESLLGASSTLGPRPRKSRPWVLRTWQWGYNIMLAICVMHGASMLLAWFTRGVERHASPRATSPYGAFPDPDDPFLFIPCTNASLPPALDDAEPERSWAKRFDPDPGHWSWGNKSTAERDTAGARDPHAGQGIYLCGYLDVPLDYVNASDPRIVRLAVTKFQVSGLARADDAPPPQHAGRPAPGTKSERTIVIEPGGPGGSGTSYVWRAGEAVTRRLSGGRFDVLGWDPRGVNATLPALSCFPHDADRDRWERLLNRYREEAGASPRLQLQVADAMFDSMFRGCQERHGDLPRFVSTALVARDLEQLRLALGEDELTGYLVSYGTGIGQTYANMFPDSVGRMILDGTEYVRDHRLLGGFGWTALDNSTNAWHDGFLGECLNAGPEHCALAKSRDGRPVELKDLEERMWTLVSSLAGRPVPGYTEANGPTLVTYSELVASIYRALYDAKVWPSLARMLFELEEGNSTLITAAVDSTAWQYNPASPSVCGVAPQVVKPSSAELEFLVICSDAYDDPEPPEGLDWWESLWANMTATSWIAGNSRFFTGLPCRHFTKYWPTPAEVYRGSLDHKLRYPVLLIAETYDPATPLRNGRRLLAEMGENARLIAHHGYGHSSRDTSNCTDSIARGYILHGTLPEQQETACYADEKPYLYSVKAAEDGGVVSQDPVEAWQEHIRELAMMRPGLV